MICPQGSYSREQYMEEIKTFTMQLIGNVRDMQVAAAPLPAGIKSFGDCPVCDGGQVIESPKSYSCHQWKNAGCQFVIWKEMSARPIKPTHVKELLSDGKTKKVIKGFKSREGKAFDAFLSLKEGKVKFMFENDNEKESLGKCPLCEKGDIIETQKAYSCNQWRDTKCGFVIWKEIAKRKISIPEAKILVKDGRTEKLSGFKSRAGKDFECILVMQEGKVQFEFNS